MESVHKLTRCEQTRVTGVVMYTFKSLVNYVSARCCEQLYFISVIIKNPLEECKMNGKHLGNQNCIFLSHFLGEEKSAVFIIYKLCHKRLSASFHKNSIH